MSTSTSPAHPTQIRKRLTGGRLVGVDGSVWLCRSVPMAPVLDAKDSRSLLAANRPITEAIDELAALATPRTDRRSINKSSYRRIHILSVDIPRSFTPPEDHPQAARLRAEYLEVSVHQRITLFAVRLTDRLGGDDGLRAAIDSITESLVAGGAPISDYDPDAEVVDAICARVGMRVPTDDEIRAATAWWNYGWVPEVIDLEHLDHLHIFASPDSARAAAGIGDENCERFAGMADHAAFAFGAVEDFDLPFFSVEEDDPTAAWGAKLMALGATVVSVRGLCEPARITRGELRRHRKKFLDDLGERANSRHGSLSRAEQEEMLGDLTGMEGLYAGGGPATLVDTSIVVGFSGMGERGYDLSELGVAAGLRIAPMVRRQRAAWSETMLCSPVSASPYLHDLPSHMVAASGLTSLSTVGDQGIGALVGFTERDRQPAWLSPVAASNEDELPLAVVVGQSGSGKLLTLGSRIPTPSGWTRMGDLEIGDQVIGRDGRPCQVTFLSDINEHPELYRVCLDDGQELLADADHQWVVSNLDDTHGPDGPEREQVLTTAAIIAGGATRYAIRVADAVDLPDRPLPYDPYLVGWEAGGGPVEPGRSAYRWRIPGTYLRAGTGQRLALLQGLTDAAGVVDETGMCELTMPARTLRPVDDPGEDPGESALELVRSLGIKASRTPGGTIRFRTSKIEPVASGTVAGEPDRWLHITSITPVPTEPGRCIQVDSPDHTYLAEGFVPTHNTMTMLHLATQFAGILTAKGERTPVVVLDPKSESNLAPAVETVGGQVASLDDITSGDGIYDPIRFSPTAQAGVELAASLLGQINPWGSKAADFETPLLQSLAYGVERGATCIGESLQIAQRDRIAPTEMVERVFALSASPLFRACVGFNPGTTGLRVAEGVTYIRVGGTYLDLPAPGSTNITQTQRISAALIRMMVFGSAMALTGRQGVVMLDEAWVFVQAGRSELERLGRLARSQQVLPMLFTQFARDILDEGLAGAISRGLVLSFREPDEARAALELFRIEATPERLERLLGPATVGGIDGAANAPNWSSFRALRDFETRKVLRGSIALYSDLHRRAVPVEVVIPPSLFLAASTNPEDIRRREAMRAAALKAAAARA